MIPRRYWTPDEEALLRARYANEPTEALAAELGREVRRVLVKANAMGLKKSRELIAKIARARTGPDHPSVAYRWQPRAEPWNKGVKGSTGHHPNTRATQFRPGSKPHTWVPVGSLRVVGGVLEIKFSDDRGSPHKRWRPYATHVWVQAHGPVPEGHLVVFRPGVARSIDPAAITVDQVECITRAEIMARNTMHRLPKDLARVIQLRGVLTRAINSIRKDQQET